MAGNTGTKSARSEPDVVRHAAERIIAGMSRMHTVDPVRDLIGESDIELAYAVQESVNHRREAAGGIVVGRKIGLTSPVVQRQLGVNQPDFGVLFADMDVSGAKKIPSSRLLQPKAEAEIAFVLSTDLDDDVSDTGVRAAVDYAVAALEIVDSRIENWDIRITDTIADNASSGLFALADTAVGLDEFDPREVNMQMYIDGVLASQGTGADCLGGPLNALAWLARTALQFGNPLRAGQIVLSGALGPMVAAPAGTHIRADLGPLGSIHATLSSKEGR